MDREELKKLYHFKEYRCMAWLVRATGRTTRDFSSYEKAIEYAVNFKQANPARTVAIETEQLDVLVLSLPRIKEV